MRHLEDQHQAALFRWARVKRVMVNGELGWLADYLFAIPNGGRRDAREAARMKAQGVKAGVSDLHLPIPVEGKHGLWIEMKAPKPAQVRVSAEQKAWIEKMNALGHEAVVCRGFDEARAVIEAYLSRGVVA